MFVTPLYLLGYCIALLDALSLDSKCPCNCCYISCRVNCVVYCILVVCYADKARASYPLLGVHFVAPVVISAIPSTHVVSSSSGLAPTFARLDLEASRPWLVLRIPLAFCSRSLPVLNPDKCLVQGDFPDKSRLAYFELDLHIASIVE